MKSLLIFFLIPFLLGAESKYPHIKALIDSEQYHKAEVEIQKVAKDFATDPNLSYLQTEIWFQKAEREYEKENFPEALTFYERAAKDWVGNHLLEDRIKETKNKIKYGSKKNISIDRKDSIVSSLDSSKTIQVIILDPDTQEKFKSQIIPTNQNTENFVIPKYYFIFFLGILLSLVLANFLILIIYFREKDHGLMREAVLNLTKEKK